MPEQHQCVLPLTGALFQCSCGKWYHVVMFKDEETNLEWKGWAPLDE